MPAPTEKAGRLVYNLKNAFRAKYGAGATMVERHYFDTGRDRIIAIHNGPRAEIIMVLERFGAERGYEAGVFESEREPGITHVRPRYIFITPTA